MALIQWKQIDPRLLGNGQLTGSLELTGSITLNGQTITSFASITGSTGGSGIFDRTGSFYSTTNDTQFTGSLEVELGLSKDFTIRRQGKDLLKVNNSGVLQLTTQSLTPTAVKGGLYLDSSYSLFIGQE